MWVGRAHHPLHSLSFNISYPNKRISAQIYIGACDLSKLFAKIHLWLAIRLKRILIIMMLLMFFIAVPMPTSVVPTSTPTPTLSPTPDPTTTLIPTPSTSVPGPTPTVVTDSPSTTTQSPQVGMGGDPHFSILLPNHQQLCFSVQGQHDYSFNLISNKLIQMNARFIQDAKRDEVTWIGSLGIVVMTTSTNRNTTKIRFEAEDKMIYIGEKLSLHVKKIDRLTFSNGKLTVSEALRNKKEKKFRVHVELVDVGLSFRVDFVKGHLDMTWNKVGRQPANSHGIIGVWVCVWVYVIVCTGNFSSNATFGGVRNCPISNLFVALERPIKCCVQFSDCFQAIFCFRA